MPKVRDLKQQVPPANGNYVIEGDGIRIEVRHEIPSESFELPPMSDDVPVFDRRSNAGEEKSRSEHRALRDRVFQYLRNHVAGFEEKQRKLKKFVKNNYKECELRHVVTAANKEATANSHVLDHLYRVVRFLRSGKDEMAECGYPTEQFFNEHFHNGSFRNDFWTYWNKRHNPSEVKTETPTETAGEPEHVPAPPTNKPESTPAATGNTKPYHCPKCNQFVSRKTNWCKRCGEEVSPE